MATTVNVWGKPYVVTAHMKSKSVWVASGDYMGKPISVQDRSEGSAIALWRKTAEYRGNG